MSTSSILNRWLNRVYKSAAILLVVFAVLISSLRMFLPYAHHYREDVQNYINEQNNSDLIIGSFNMGWQKLGPTLIVENVAVLDTETTAIFIQKMESRIDFWQSLRKRRLVTSDLTLTGAKVLFEPGAISQKIKAGGAQDDAKPSGDDSMVRNIAEVFLNQVTRFSLLDSQIIVRKPAEEKTFLISELEWLNTGNRHQARGDVIVDGLTSNNVKVMLDATGEEFDDLNGQLYIAANELNITPWLDRVFAIDDENTHSSINFNAWLAIKDGQAKSLQVSLGDNLINWQHQGQKDTIMINQGQLLFLGVDQAEHMSMHSTPIHVAINEKPWQPITIEATRDENGLFSYVSNLDLAGVAELLPLFVEDSKTKQLIEKLSITGDVEDLRVLHHEGKMSVSARLSQVDSEYEADIPGLKNVNADISYINDQLSLTIRAKDGELDFGPHFKRPMPYQELNAQVDINQLGNDWQIVANEVLLSSKELTLAADLQVDIPEEGSAEMALLAHVNNDDATVIRHYYPHVLMGDDLVEYLEGAIVSGELSQAQVLFKGAFSDFPFEDNNGIFVVDAELENSRFKFDSEWPAINHFDANLNFTNNSMVITGREGFLAGIDVGGVVAKIDDLSDEQILTVDADLIDTAPDKIGLLMNNSPMADTVGESLEEIVISKNISGLFSLNLPLNDVDSVVAKGEIYLHENEIALQTPRMDFTRVKGTLVFNNEVITVESLDARWLGLPLKVKVDARDKVDRYETQLQISADWLEHKWHRNIPSVLRKYGKGSLNWQGDLVIKLPYQGDFSYELAVTSSLSDAILALPEPYIKPFGTERALTVNVKGERLQSTINGDMGAQLSFFGILNHENVSFTSAHLILGDERMLMPRNGFHITTKLEYADFAHWQPFILDIVDAVDSASQSSNDVTDTSPPLLDVPERIRGDIDNFYIFDQKLTDVSFELNDKVNWWTLDLQAKEARTNVKFYPDWHEQGIDVDADFIHLAQQAQPVKDKVAEVEESEEVKKLKTDGLFENIPPMKFSCDSCRFGKVDLGKLNFVIVREEKDLISLEHLTAGRDKSKLTLQAHWSRDDTKSQTFINGSMSTKDFAFEYEKMGSPSTVRDSGFKSSFNINWRGGPHQFSLATLNGDFSASLDDGYLAEIPDKARVFSVLSLQSLVRKLSFDFRDMFSDGMFYSSIDGKFQLKDGVLYTQNTQLKGPAGDLTIKGNTDLPHKTLDYHFSYKPNVTSSLPAIAWIATLNPVTFLAGVALEEVITSQVYYEINYEITGNIEEPIITEVDRKTRNVRVGRDRPPEIVESAAETPTAPPIIGSEQGVTPSPKAAVPEIEKIDG